jgi:hypothetical protein
MNILVCIDDTDNLESRGTGELASLLASQLEELGWGESRFVTRHQLLVHPDIPYTSHNSSMCFAATLREASLLPRFIDHAGRFLERESAPGSDPGLCVAASLQLGDPAPLVAFGYAAKEQVLDKAAAYALAGELGIHLSEHGGSGQGVVGAVAGVGLRLGGNDGRLKGRLPLGPAGARRSVAELRSESLVEAVWSTDGPLPEDAELVELGEKVKTVLLERKSVLLLEKTGDPAVPWRTCSRQKLKHY